ncbi:hypothetical protein [Mucilaginibacter lappiensis]|uniref:Uncharacterized protein n=1 Tax=Mucilaginibacter lappiensis TaxID=354630 RepID=A0A841JHJ8_9SPHI|nr:hypothetical protein [Mucilaginibacter lappiensis]MBB6130390.1 hypothetical protein [Mucilaginibacter lappiensis]
MKEIITTYYRLPIGSIPFHEIPSLEDFNYEYIYCSSFPLIDFMGLDFYLVSVFNIFDNDFTGLDDFEKKELLFGQVVSDKLSTRGKAKCLKAGAITSEISETNLPDLKYSSSNTNPKDGNWFYMKEGKYVIFSGIKSEYEKVIHLEGIALYGDNIIRLRIVIELLKKNVKDGLLELFESDYKNIAYKVLRTDPTLLKTDNNTIWDGVNNWLPSMLSTPLYEDIPEEKKGKAEK